MKRKHSIAIRRGTRADSEEFLELLIDFAKFENKEPPDKGARVRIIEDIFDKKLAKLFVADSGEKLIGYALYFHTYSSFSAHPILYLEDIFVHSEHRRKGLGLALLRRCAREALKHDCNKMEWSVLPWNRRAINFYEKLGPKKLDLLSYEIDPKRIEKLHRPES